MVYPIGIVLYLQLITMAFHPTYVAYNENDIRYMW